MHHYEPNPDIYEDIEKNQSGFRIDCHVHSKFSGDAYLRSCKPNKLLKRAFSSSLDCIVVTDKNQDRFFDRVSADIKKDLMGMKIAYQDNELILLEKKDKALYLLRGMEIHDDRGHLLIIGGEKQIKYNPDNSLIERINQAHDEDRIIGPAHLYNVYFGGIGQENLERFHDKFDFIEIFNSLNSFERDNYALDASEKYSLPGLSNSDDHNCRPGIAYSVLDINQDIQIEKLAAEIKNSIKQGKILGYARSYTGMPEKLWVFLVKDILNGGFRSIPDRIKRTLKLLKEKYS